MRQSSARPDDRLVCSPHNAQGNAVSQLQRCHHQHPHSPHQHPHSPHQHPHSPTADAASLPCLYCSAAFSGTTARFAHYTVLTVTSRVEWKEGQLSAEYQLFTSSDLPIFHQSREMEISLRELSRRNLTRTVHCCCMRVMMYP